MKNEIKRLAAALLCAGLISSHASALEVPVTPTVSRPLSTLTLASPVVLPGAFSVLSAAGSIKAPAAGSAVEAPVSAPASAVAAEQPALPRGRAGSFAGRLSAAVLAVSALGTFAACSTPEKAAEPAEVQGVAAVDSQAGGELVIPAEPLPKVAEGMGLTSVPGGIVYARLDEEGRPHTRPLTRGEAKAVTDFLWFLEDHPQWKEQFLVQRAVKAAKQLDIKPEESPWLQKDGRGGLKLTPLGTNALPGILMGDPEGRSMP